MTNTIAYNKIESNFFDSITKLLFVLSVVFLLIVGLTICQDFLESRRSGYAFNFDESLLFKIVWFLFIPILTILYKKLKNETANSAFRTAMFIVLPIAVHLFILPLVAVIFSVLFFEGRYDLYKFFSYALAHDFYKLVIVYSGFVLGYKYWFSRQKSISNEQNQPALNTIVINNGKGNVVVNVADITQITSATPYIFIHLENKKHLHSETLKSICERLDSNLFIRVHKSTIVNISKISSFKSRLNGDYDLQLKCGDFVRLSRSYAANFKQRFNTSHRVNG